MYNHKKMESAFIKALKHISSKQYQYVIVADRGFGHQRFIEYCEECGFECLLCLKSKIMVKYSENSGFLEDLIKKSDVFDVYVEIWQKNATITYNQKDGKEWYLVTNIKGIAHKEAVEIYKDRFKIEKCFQDLKSSGFDIESSKIKKYDRFKRLLALCVISHSISVIVGTFIDKHRPAIKKNFPIHTKLISAYSPSQSEPLQPFLNEL